MDDLALEIMVVKQEREDYIAGYRKRIEQAEKHFDEQLDKLYEKCDHSYSDFKPYFFMDGRTGVFRGCESCGKREILSLERYLKESQSGNL